MADRRSLEHLLGQLQKELRIKADYGCQNGQDQHQSRCNPWLVGHVGPGLALRLLGRLADAEEFLALPSTGAQGAASAAATASLRIRAPDWFVMSVMPPPVSFLLRNRVHW